MLNIVGLRAPGAPSSAAERVAGMLERFFASSPNKPLKTHESVSLKKANENKKALKENKRALKGT
jgi:hypothetical protein